MCMWTYNYMNFWCVWMLSYSSAHIEIKVFFRTGIMRCTVHSDKRNRNSDFNTWIPLPARSRGPEGVLHRRRRIDICFCKWSCVTQYIFGHFRDINGKFEFRTWQYRFQTEHRHVNNIKDCKILTFSRLLCSSPLFDFFLVRTKMTMCHVTTVLLHLVLSLHAKRVWYSSKQNI